MAAQDQSLRTRWVKQYIGRTTDSPKWRNCAKMNGNVSHKYQSELKHKMSTRSSYMIKLQLCRTSGGARLVNSMKSYKHFVEKGIRVLELKLKLMLKVKVNVNVKC